MTTVHTKKIACLPNKIADLTNKFVDLNFDRKKKINEIISVMIWRSAIIIMTSRASLSYFETVKHILPRALQENYTQDFLGSRTYRAFSLLNLLSVSQYYHGCWNFRDLLIAEKTAPPLAPLVLLSLQFNEMIKFCTYPTISEDRRLTSSTLRE